MFPCFSFQRTSVSRRWPRQYGAYTLLELMIVLAIIAMIAGLSWPALMRPWSRSLSQQAAQQLAKQLIHTRAKAIERSCVYEMQWEPGGRAFRIRALDGSSAPNDPLTLTESERLGAGSLPERIDEPLPVQQPAGSVGSAAADTSAGIRAVGDLEGERTATPEAASVAEELPLGVRFQGGSPAHAQASDPLSDPANPLSDGTSLSTSVEVSKLPADEAVAAERGGETDDSMLASDTAWSEPVRFYPDGRSSTAKWTIHSDDGYEVDVTLRGITGVASIGRVRNASAPTIDPGNELESAGEVDPSSNSASPLSSSGPNHSASMEATGIGSVR